VQSRDEVKCIENRACMECGGVLVHTIASAVRRMGPSGFVFLRDSIIGPPMVAINFLQSNMHKLIFMTFRPTWQQLHAGWGVKGLLIVSLKSHLPCDTVTIAYVDDRWRDAK